MHSYGHAQYITMAYPELAEKAPLEDDGENTDLVSKDKRPDTFYYHTLCPLHKDYYKVMFNIIDEVLEVVKPKRFVHMGHDEIYEVGKCPECKKVPRGDLLANEINTLNDYIKSKNLTMIIWSDMFHNMSYSAMPAINKVSKDVIMMDFVWYFHLDKDLEDNLLSHGFKVMMGNMNSSHYPRFESRSHKDGMIGAEVSIWLPCDEITYAFNGKVYEFVYAAEGMWNSDYDSTMRLSYNEIIKPIMNSALTNITTKTTNAGPPPTKNIASALAVSRLIFFSLYKVAIPFAPTGNPPHKPKIITLPISPFVLKSRLVMGVRYLPSHSENPLVTIKEEITIKGKSDGIRMLPQYKSPCKSYLLAYPIIVLLKI